MILILQLLQAHRLEHPWHHHKLGSGTFFLPDKMTCDTTQFFVPAQTDGLFLNHYSQL